MQNTKMLSSLRELMVKYKNRCSPDSGGCNNRKILKKDHILRRELIELTALLIRAINKITHIRKCTGCRFINADMRAEDISWRLLLLPEGKQLQKLLLPAEQTLERINGNN